MPYLQANPYQLKTDNINIASFLLAAILHN